MAQLCSTTGRKLDDNVRARLNYMLLSVREAIEAGVRLDTHAIVQHNKSKAEISKEKNQGWEIPNTRAGSTMIPSAVIRVITKDITKFVKENKIRRDG